MYILIIGLVVFLGIHSIRIFAPTYRDVQIEKFGEKKWKGIYSLISLLSLIAIIWGYSLARPDAEIIYVRPDWGPIVTIILMFFAFCLQPFNLSSSRLHKITHHPFMLSVVLWCVAHLISNGDMASIVLFGSFLVWALVDWQSARSRNAPLPPIRPLKTDLVCVTIAIAIWFLFIFVAHEWLFGVPVIS